MNDEQVRDLLQDIARAAVSPYPFTEAVDPRYAIALGMIAGIAHEGLAAVAEDRPMRLDAR